MESLGTCVLIHDVRLAVVIFSFIKGRSVRAYVCSSPRYFYARSVRI
jgi:hypothetical protein